MTWIADTTIVIVAAAGFWCCRERRAAALTLVLGFGTMAVLSLQAAL